MEFSMKRSRFFAITVAALLLFSAVACAGSVPDSSPETPEPLATPETDPDFSPAVSF